MNARARTEDVRWMITGGECLTGAARRLGISADGLEKWLTVHDLRAELDALRAHEPVTLVDHKPRTGGRPERPAPCGTERAYQRHYYRGEPIDDECREAHATYERERVKAS